MYKKDNDYLGLILIFIVGIAFFAVMAFSILIMAKEFEEPKVPDWSIPLSSYVPEAHDTSLDMVLLTGKEKYRIMHDTTVTLSYGTFRRYDSLGYLRTIAFRKNDGKLYKFKFADSWYFK